MAVKQGLKAQSHPQLSALRIPTAKADSSVASSPVCVVISCRPAPTSQSVIIYELLTYLSQSVVVRVEVCGVLPVRDPGAGDHQPGVGVVVHGAGRAQVRLPRAARSHQRRVLLLEAGAGQQLSGGDRALRRLRKKREA
jgi:hypothetical protein